MAIVTKVVGTIGFVFKGDFSEESPYKKLNVVRYNNNVYVCSQDTTAGTLPTDTNYWDLFVEGMSINNYYTKEEVDSKDRTYTLSYDDSELSLTDQLGIKQTVTIESGGTNVSVEQTLTEGTEIATITVDDVPTKIYAPSGSGGSSGADYITYNYNRGYCGVLINETDVEQIKQSYNLTNIEDIAYFTSDSIGHGIYKGTRTISIDDPKENIKEILTNETTLSSFEKGDRNISCYIFSYTTKDSNMSVVQMGGSYTSVDDISSSIASSSNYEVFKEKKVKILLFDSDLLNGDNYTDKLYWKLYTGVYKTIDQVENACTLEQDGACFQYDINIVDNWYSYYNNKKQQDFYSFIYPYENNFINNFKFFLGSSATQGDEQEYSNANDFYILTPTSDNYYSPFKLVKYDYYYQYNPVTFEIKILK